MKQAVLAQPDGLLEREAEVERVRDALRGVGRSLGVTLVIEGAAGIGKSRLLEAARARGAQLGFTVLAARATELEQRFPYGVMRQLFERLLLDADTDQRARWSEGAASLAGEVVTGASVSGAGGAIAGSMPGDSGYPWQHGLYWLASNISTESPLVLLVDDLQWCDAPSARALTFLARRLHGLPIALILAARPLDPDLTPEAAGLAADRDTEVLRLAPLSPAAVEHLISSRLPGISHERFTKACLTVTGGNPFLLGELLGEAAARGVQPTAAAAAQVGSIVPRGVANAVLLRLARLPSPTAALARALSVLGDGAQTSDAARLAGLSPEELEPAIPSLVAAGVLDSGTPVRFVHPILRTAIYEDLSPAERERLHCSASKILERRGAPVSQVAAHVMRTEPVADFAAVTLMRQAAHDALALGDADGAAALFARALEEPPRESERGAVVLELGLARARAGMPEAVQPLTEIVEHGDDATAIATAASELGGMLFLAGRAADGAAVLRHAQERLPAAGPAWEQLEVALLAASYTSVSARREADSRIAQLRDPGGPANGVLQATTLATLAMDEVTCLRSASRAIDLARRALAAGLPGEPHRGENWVVLALAALVASDALDEALTGVDAILTPARAKGSALTIVTMSSLRAIIGLRSGDLGAAQADAQTAMEIAPELLGAEFAGLAVAAAVLAGLDGDETAASLRRLIDGAGIRHDTEFMPNAPLRYASGVLRAAAGNHEAAITELRGCDLDHPAYGGGNPAMLPWRSAAALSEAELGHHEAAQELAADEVRRAQAFGARRAIGIAIRVAALVGPPAQRSAGLRDALAVLEGSPARLEHARVLIDLGATLRAGGQRNAAREPLLDGLGRAVRCQAHELERRARTELAAVGVRPRGADRVGADSLTASERRVADLAAAGGTNREIAQTLFVTEKTVETHLGRAFRKLDITSRRQLRDVLASTSG
jgi:DNA-binding CsgD family transcriptional regulator/tetratricopeptide (TPR) repeat protein